MFKMINFINFERQIFVFWYILAIQNYQKLVFTDFAVLKLSKTQFWPILKSINLRFGEFRPSISGIF